MKIVLKTFLSLTTTALLADATAIEMAPLSVTATGIKESLVEQALSISTKNKAEIELDQVIFQKDLLNSISGVRVEQTGSVIGHMTAIRMPINTGSYYLFMQDGIPVQSSGFFNHNGLAYTTFQSSSSVEVLKGAGTALYGSDAVAAVVNVQSLQKPSAKREVSVKGMLGSNAYRSAYVEMSDTVSKSASYRASFNLMSSDGWRENTKSKRVEANIRYDMKIGSDNDVKFIFNTSKTDAEQADTFNDYANVKNGSSAASDDANYFTAINKTDIKRKFDYARLSAEWSNYAFEDVDIILTPYIRYNRNRYVATWTPNLPSNDNELFTLGLLQKNVYEASWGKIIGGFDAEYTQSSLKYNQDFDITTTGWGASTYTKGALYDYNVDYMALAPYIHSEYQLTKKLTLTAGLRYDYNQYEYKNNLAQNSYDSSGKFYRIADKKDNFSHLSPKLSLSFMAMKNMNIYLRYANGFRIPQASRLYSMQKGYESVSLNPETSNTFELGVKKYFSKKSSVELALYYMSIDATITRYKNSVTKDYYYDNGGSTLHKGVELTLKSKLNSEYSANVSYSLSKHNYVNDAKYANNEMQQAPEQTGNFRLIYTPEALHALQAMAEYEYVSSWWMNDEHSVDRYKGYAIVNLKADYKYSKALKFFAKVTNITDERYAVMASYAYKKSDYTPADPRQFYAGIEYIW